MRISHSNCYFCFLQWIAVFVTRTSCFNLDTRYPILYQNGVSDDYFGFSVGLLQSTSGYKALITAPRSNSNVSTAVRNLRQPGALLSCDTEVLGEFPTCKEVAVEKKGNSNYNSARPDVQTSYAEKKDYMWLGVSLDVQENSNDNNVVVCGHLWKNKKREDNHYAVNGVCYVMKRDLNEKGVKKLIPFLQSKSVGPKYHNKSGEAGTSASFSEDGQYLLLGAPGFSSSRGTIISYVVNSDTKEFEFVNPIIPDTTKLTMPSGTPYIGYSITSGKFFGGNTTYSAVGAPRDGNYHGTVYIFHPLDDEASHELIKESVHGEQFGEYFGASVSGIDLNDDGLTDLLVGAPFYSFENGGDEGRVYVYIGNKQGFFSSSTKLIGQQQPNARFGSCIGSAGDLNQDGFNDVAIGAPYEDENGAVYIYHGTSNGLNVQYAQRIGAKDFEAKISGFGISISRGLDVDNNSYPDLLIGSYASSSAVLLRTYPVIKMSPTKLMFHPPKINRNLATCKFGEQGLPCFNIIYCLGYSGKYVQQSLEFETELKMDTARGFLLSNNTRQTSVFRKMKLNKDSGYKCLNETAYINNNVTDEVNPIPVFLSFDLDHDAILPFCPNNSFSKLCPVIDPNLSKNITKSIHFPLNCGEDNECWADLIVEADVLGNPKDKAIIIGQNSTLTLNVKISNHEEPAYGSVLFIYIPPEVPIVQHDFCDKVEKQEEEYANTIILRCDLGNSLTKDKERTLQIKIDVANIPTTTLSLNVHFEVTTLSNETDPTNNVWNLPIHFIAAAGINITGNPEDRKILYTNETISVSIIHKYYVRYFGPSPVSKIDITLLVPTAMLKENDLVTFLTFGELKIVTVGIETTCNVSFENIDLTDYNTTEHTEIIFKKSNQKKVKTGFPEVSNASNSHLLREGSATEGVTVSPGKRGEDFRVDCGKAECETIFCEVGPFLSGQKTIMFIMSAQLNLTVLNSVMGAWNSITFITKGKISMHGVDILSEKYRNETTVETMIVRPGPPASAEVQNWIIIVSIGAGILVLLIILAVLFKTGFFKRKRREKMKRMMHQGSLKELQQMPNDDPVVTADDNILFGHEHRT